MVLEGTYPFISGGVSSWTHDLLKAQSHLRFTWCACSRRMPT
jgi:hypothetical protein